MTATKVPKHGPGLRFVGFTLWVPALLTLLLTAGCAVFVTGSSVASTPGEHVARRGRLRATLVDAKVSQEVLADFDKRGIVSAELLATIDRTQQEAVSQALADYYRETASDGAGRALGAAFGGCGVVFVYVLGVPLFIVGLLLCASRRVWQCARCGYLFERG